MEFVTNTWTTEYIYMTVQFVLVAEELKISRKFIQIDFTLSRNICAR